MGRQLPLMVAIRLLLGFEKVSKVDVTGHHSQRQGAQVTGLVRLQLLALTDRGWAKREVEYESTSEEKHGGIAA